MIKHHPTFSKLVADIKWNLTDLQNVKKNDLKVFSCFSCGGGSSMGYKLSGYEVLGCCEIDKQMIAIYKKNHNPKYPFLMGVQDFYKQDKSKIPNELFDLDILDGSPPCSLFSISSLKAKEKWGKKTFFREGQAAQVLDDLFFEFIKVADLLKPKVVVAENVTGMLKGQAKGYIDMIAKNFQTTGYNVQLFHLNAAFMGVPQKRNRVFFVAIRKDINKKINLSFDFKPITFSYCRDKDAPKTVLPPFYKVLAYWSSGEQKLETAYKKATGKSGYFGYTIAENSITPSCQTASVKAVVMPDKRYVSDKEIQTIQTFPQDYDFLNADAQYVCGMSVPPIMMKYISQAIAEQIFNIDYGVQ